MKARRKDRAHKEEEGNTRTGSMNSNKGDEYAKFFRGKAIGLLAGSTGERSQKPTFSTKAFTPILQ